MSVCSTSKINNSNHVQRPLGVPILKSKSYRKMDDSESAVIGRWSSACHNTNLTHALVNHLMS